MTDSQDEQNDDAAREEAERFEEARTDALADTHDEEGELDAIPVDLEADEEGELNAKPDYPIAHVVDIEEDQRMSMCGEEIEGDLLGNRVLAYTCTACQETLTARKNALADALLVAQLRLGVIQSTVLGYRGRGLDTNWSRRVRETAADATDAMLDQMQSGPRTS